MDHNFKPLNHESCPHGCINRRKFITLSIAAAACCHASNFVYASTQEERVIDAGPVHGYSADGVYIQFRDLGFFVIRSQSKLIVLSSICTHKKCKLTAESDRSFYCDCHGSTFNPDGKVTEGPAKRDLPVLASFTNEKGHLMVKVS